MLSLPTSTGYVRAFEADLLWATGCTKLKFRPRPPPHAFPKSAERREECPVVPLHNARLGMGAAGLSSSSTVEGVAPY